MSVRIQLFPYLLMPFCQFSTYRHHCWSMAGHFIFFDDQCQQSQLLWRQPLQPPILIPKYDLLANNGQERTISTPVEDPLSANNLPAYAPLKLTTIYMVLWFVQGLKSRTICMVLPLKQRSNLTTIQMVLPLMQRSKLVRICLVLLLVQRSKLTTNSVVLSLM